VKAVAPLSPLLKEGRNPSKIRGKVSPSNKRGVGECVWVIWFNYL
jgi:hypothetical protein